MIAAVMRQAITTSMRVRSAAASEEQPAAPAPRPDPEASPTVRSLMADAALEGARTQSPDAAGVLGEWTFDRAVCRVHARIVSHPRYAEGLSITTARIVAVRGPLIETATGSQYRLRGPPVPAADDNGGNPVSLVHDEANPLAGIAPDEILIGNE
jgi:hypothetical protein